MVLRANSYSVCHDGRMHRACVDKYASVAEVTGLAQWIKSASSNGIYSLFHGTQKLQPEHRVVDCISSMKARLRLVKIYVAPSRMSKVLLFLNVITIITDCTRTILKYSSNSHLSAIYQIATGRVLPQRIHPLVKRAACAPVLAPAALHFAAPIVELFYVRQARQACYLCYARA
jgi:hypothetical protein